MGTVCSTSKGGWVADWQRPTKSNMPTMPKMLKMVKPIRAKFGRFMYDAYVPSNIEVLFEFLHHFDEVPLPDDNSYRIAEGFLQVKRNGETWEDDECVNYLIDIVKDFTSDDWGDLEKVSPRDNVIRLDRP